MIVNRYVNGVYVKEEDIAKIVIKNPDVVAIFEKVKKRVNSAYMQQKGKELGEIST